MKRGDIVVCDQSNAMGIVVDAIPNSDVTRGLSEYQGHIVFIAGTWDPQDWADRVLPFTPCGDCKIVGNMAEVLDAV